MLWFVVATALFLSGCGDSEERGTLLIAAEGSPVRIEASSQALGTAPISSSSTTGSLAIAWIRNDPTGASELVGEILDANLSPINTAIRLSEGEPSIPMYPALCSQSDTFSVAWSSTPRDEELPQGITLDTGNVFAVASWTSEGFLSEAVRVNPNTIGQQRIPSIACLPDGGRMLSWVNACIAVNRISDIGFVRFRPDECDIEPEDGTYLQSFNASGTPAISATRIADTRFHRTPMESLQDGRVILILPDGIQIRAGTGELLEEELTETPDLSEGELACGTNRCAAVSLDDSLAVWPFPVAPLSIPSGVLVRETTRVSPTETIRPVDPHIACGLDEICLVTWLLERRIQDGDVIHLESLGVFGRAVDLHTGQMGAEVELDPAPEATQGAQVEPIGKSTFVSIRTVQGAIEIQRYRIN